MTILLSLDPQKSRSSRGTSDNERIYPISSPFSTFTSSIFLAPSALHAHSSVRQESLGAQKAVKAIKVPESSARGETRQKASRVLCLSCSSLFPRNPSELGYCEPQWNCPGQLRWNLTSIRTYYLNRGSTDDWQQRQLPIFFFSCSFSRRHVMKHNRSIVKHFTVRILVSSRFTVW